jgi:hypothetical protein
MDTKVRASLTTSAMARIDHLSNAGRRLNVIVGAVRCPACGSPAVVILDQLLPVSAADLRPDETFRQLTCLTCRLEITDRAELVSAGVDLKQLDVPGLTRPARRTRLLPDDLANAEVDLFMMLVSDRDEDMLADWEPDFDGTEEPEGEAESVGESYEP